MSRVGGAAHLAAALAPKHPCWSGCNSAKASTLSNARACVSGGRPSERIAIISASGFSTLRGRTRALEEFLRHQGQAVIGSSVTSHTTPACQPRSDPAGLTPPITRLNQTGCRISAAACGPPRFVQCPQDREMFDAQQRRASRAQVLIASGDTPCQRAASFLEAEGYRVERCHERRAFCPVSRKHL